MKILTKLTLSICLVAPLTAAFAGGSTPAPGAAADKQTLVCLEHAWLRALEKHDTQALQHILADDFLDTSYQGHVRTKAEVLAGRAAPNIESERLSDLKVRVFGNAGIVTGLNTVTGAHHAWVVKIWFTDVFVKRGGRWRAVGAQETLHRTPS